MEIIAVIMGIVILLTIFIIGVISFIAGFFLLIFSFGTLFNGTESTIPVFIIMMILTSISFIIHMFTVYSMIEYMGFTGLLQYEYFNIIYETIKN